MTVASVDDFRNKTDTDDTGAFKRAIAAVQGTSVALSMSGRSYVVSSTLQITAPINLFGVGAGSGPGLVCSTGCSRIVCAPGFTSGDVLSVSSYYGCIFRDFQIAESNDLTFLEPSTRGPGSALHISAPNPGTSVNECSRVENVAFSGFNVPLRCTLCQDQVIEACYFQAWGNVGYYADNAGTAIESSGGHVRGNKFFGDTSAATTQGYGILSLHGYTTIDDNLVLGSRTGIAIVGSEHSIASIRVKSNAIEEQTDYGIVLQQVDPYLISCVQFTGNEFSNITNRSLSDHIVALAATSGSLFNMDLSDNDFSSILNGGGASCINAQIGENVTITRNRASIVGAYMALGIPSHLVRDNRIRGNPTAGGYYNCTNL